MRTGVSKLISRCASSELVVTETIHILTHSLDPIFALLLCHLESSFLFHVQSGFGVVEVESVDLVQLDFRR